MARNCWAPDASTSTPSVEPLRSRAVARKLRTAAVARSGAGVRGFGVDMTLDVPPGLAHRGLDGARRAHLFVRLGVRDHPHESRLCAISAGRGVTSLVCK